MAFFSHFCLLVTAKDEAAKSYHKRLLQTTEIKIMTWHKTSSEGIWWLQISRVLKCESCNSITRLMPRFSATFFRLLLCHREKEKARNIFMHDETKGLRRDYSWGLRQKRWTSSQAFCFGRSRSKGRGIQNGLIARCFIDVPLHVIPLFLEKFLFAKIRLCSFYLLRLLRRLSSKHQTPRS